MENHGESVADVITGGVVARAVEPTAGEAREAPGHGNCPNCQAALTGAYCSNCGQPAHLHRSFLSLGHDILHGVFHFEGKIWRTLPELLFRPGRLTRRYIDGERAKFISPMALYLFAVFLMFAVFSFGGGNALSPSANLDVLGVRQQWQENIATDIERLNGRIEAQQELLAEPDLSDAGRERARETLAGLIATREAMEAMLSGDMEQISRFFETQERRAREQVAASSEQDQRNRLEAVIDQASENPALLAYKLKTAGYKYSWALVPLSVPFLWLLFFWRRDIRLYDHAIFITYSISFMMIFLVMLSLAALLGVSGVIWGMALIVVPPIHLYKQLRVAYGLSRLGTWIRLFALSIMIFFVLLLFSGLLFALGMTG